MQNVKIDIINDKALKLLQDLEELNLIRLRKDRSEEKLPDNDLTKYKGAMSKKHLNEIDQQLKELRSEWE